MRVAVVYGQSHRGMTWNVVRILLSELDPDRVDEFLLPDDGPGCCIGCCRCFLEGEDACPHSGRMSPILSSILASDVVILASPDYVDGMSGAMKDLCDHMAFAWMSHRPQPEMFAKTGVAISTSAGATNRRVLSSMARQMRSWMIPRVFSAGLVSHARSFEELGDRRRRRIEARCARIARRIRSGDGKAPFSIRQRLMFAIFRAMQSGDAAWNEKDRSWWEEKGWLGDGRPWRKRSRRVRSKDL